MLVLSRKQGESVRIGTDVTITLLDVRQGRVKIGITAPADVPILRTELMAAPVAAVCDADGCPTASSAIIASY